MNIKKTKLAFALTSALFLTLPMSQVLAHEKHCEIKETQLGETMTHLKSELRAYVKGFKKGDEAKMQKHASELIKLADTAINETPMKIQMMDHEGMSPADVSEMKGMDHSKMDMAEMKGMDHSKMDMSGMEGMSADQHHQHMMYMQGMTELKDLFKLLGKANGETEIKAVLGKIKEHSKKSHQQFRQDC